MLNTKTLFNILSLIAVVTTSTPTAWAAKSRSHHATVTISGTVPVVCSINNETTDATSDSITVSLDRWCNASHHVTLSATLDDAPVTGLEIELEGQLLEGDEGEWTLFEDSPPAIDKNTLTIKVPKDLQGTTGISLSMSIQADS
jgi:hypothetical protein